MVLRESSLNRNVPRRGHHWARGARRPARARCRPRWPGAPRSALNSARWRRGRGSPPRAARSPRTPRRLPPRWCLCTCPESPEDTQEGEQRARCQDLGGRSRARGETKVCVPLSSSIEGLRRRLPEIRVQANSHQHDWGQTRAVVRAMELCKSAKRDIRVGGVAVLSFKSVLTIY